jgi:hypothetical protein
MVSALIRLSLLAEVAFSIAWILNLCSLPASPLSAKETFKQPIDFSHKRHARAELECYGCHPIGGDGRAAGLPAAGDCLACHKTVKSNSPAIQKLAAYESKETIPWVRIYQLPEFVFFSHRKHMESTVDCETCHGPVAKRDELRKERATTMKACVDCHKSRKASTACNLCHELNQ